MRKGDLLLAATAGVLQQACSMTGCECKDDQLGLEYLNTVHLLHEPQLLNVALCRLLLVLGLVIGCGLVSS